MVKKRERPQKSKRERGPSTIVGPSNIVTPPDPVIVDISMCQHCSHKTEQCLKFINKGGDIPKMCVKRGE